MFAIAPTIFAPLHHLPAHSSPLAPRDANARPRFATDSHHPFSKMQSTTARSAGPCKPITNPQRKSKYATLNRDADSERGRRRGIFLGKVKERGEEKRFEARGEQTLRIDFLAQHRAWEERQAMAAEQWQAGLDDEIEDYEEAQHQQLQQIATQGLYRGQEQDAYDEVELLGMEDQAYEQMATEAEQEPRDMTDYGSDDEDYDRLLLDIAMQTEATGQDEELVSSANQEEDHEMDTS